MEFNVIESKEDRREFFGKLYEAFIPLRKALNAFEVAIKEIDWDRLQKILDKNKI